jgi:hypothetical protein
MAVYLGPILAFLAVASFVLFIRLMVYTLRDVDAMFDAVGEEPEPEPKSKPKSKSKPESEPKQ